MSITNNTTNNQHNTIDQLARKATVGTLNKTYSASGNENIRQLQLSLQQDFRIMDGRQEGTYSEALDIYTTAYMYLYEQMVINLFDSQDTIAITQKNGIIKEYTVFQLACKAVSKEIYSNKSLNLCCSSKTYTRKDGEKVTYKTTSKFIYIEDMGGDDEDGNCALDREYIRITTNSGLATASGFNSMITANYSDYVSFNEILSKLKLTPYKKSVLVMLMQGKTTTAIAEKLGVSQQAISKQRIAIQAQFTDIFPDMVRGFKNNRIH